MKCISLFVCFFIGLQSMIVPSYEVLISNIESKVDTIHEDRASFLSLKCRDIAMDVTSKKTDLRIEMEIMKLIRTVLFGKIQLKMVQSVLDAGPIRMEVFI